MRQQIRKSAGKLAALALVLAVGAVSGANASMIRVSQESAPGAGDFDANVLGFIDPFNTGLTASGYYQYGSPNGSSYNGEANGGPNGIADTTINFFVATTNGLALFNVHDVVGAGVTDTASMAWSISGDTAAFLVGDDGSEGLNPGLGVEANAFTTAHTWLTCCTDGFVLGSLDSDWTLLGAFTNVRGISDWTVVSNSGGTISLALDLNRRVRYDVVPEPATLALLGLGLAGLGFARRRFH